MSYHAEQRVETQRQQIRSGEGTGISAPDREHDRNYNSKPRRLRATDSDEQHQQTTGRDASAGWRAEYRHQGVEPEGWRDE